MPDPLQTLRSHFPVARQWIYVNHAAVAPLSTPVAEAMQAFVRDAVENGSVNWRTWLQHREQARELAARLLAVVPSEIAFTTNTSQGLINVAEGLEWAPGDEILVVHHDFPANQIPWFRQERHGARVVVVPRDAQGRVPAEAVLERVSERTRVLALPWVLFDNGYRLDLTAIGRGLGDHPAWFVVDAIQGLGAFPLDVHAARIDALSADSHKWMLGLEGIGLFWARAERHAELDGPLVSWTSLEHPFEPYEPDAAVRGDARKHEYATLGAVGVYAMEACLELLLAAGVDAMGARILELTDRLAAGLVAGGWELVSPRGAPAECSGIVTARPPRGDAAQLAEDLAERGVSVASRGGGVRFAPHAWNTSEEIDRLLGLLG